MKYQFDSLKLTVQGCEYDKRSPRNVLSYAVGALLYTPALHATIASAIIEKKNPNIRSIAFCLEDAITDSGVKEAELTLAETLAAIHKQVGVSLTLFDLPLISVRVRNPKQLLRLFESLGPAAEIVTAVIAPKFDKNSADEYIYNFNQVAARLPDPLYLMPIIESESVLALETRAATLSSIRRKLDGISDRVLNVRVGGNDFCRAHGFRRPKHKTIYDLGVVANVLYDIMNVFGQDYVVSAPVWEYFARDGAPGAWSEGLSAELEADKLNGFTGKTAIHPSQLPIISQAFVVDYDDYEDARRVSQWSSDILAVGNSVFEERMNEVRVHKTWAERILSLANVYGVHARE